MELVNKQSITIDFYKSRMMPYYSFYQHDTNQIEFEVEENGTVPDLSGVSRAVVNIRRPDRKVVSRQLEINGNKILYDLGHEEMKVSGEALLTLQLYNDDGQRLSTAKIKINIESTVEANVEFKDKQGTLYQQIIFEMEGLKDQLFTLNKLTTEQADYAKEQGDAAKTAAELAIEETENLDEMKSATVEATGAANTAAEAATTAAETAETNAEYAKAQGDYAKEQIGIVEQRTEELNGVDAAQFKDRQDQFSAQLAEEARKISTLSTEKANLNAVRLKSEKLSQSDISEELLQQMAGDTPINSLPAPKSVSQTELALPLQEILVKSFNWELGSVLTGGGLSESSTRIRTPQVELKAGTTIALPDVTNYKYALHRYRYTDKSYIGQTGWITSPTTITEDVYGILIVAKSDDSNLSNVIKETGNQLQVYGTQSVITLRNKVEKNEQDVTNFKASYQSAQLTSRNIAANGDFKSGITGWTPVTATATVTNGEVKLKATSENGRIYTPINFNPNDVIYRSGLIKSTSNKVGIGGSSVLFKTHSGSGMYERISDVRTYNQYYMSVIDTRTSGWDDVYAKNLLAINLTQTFGSGNEPTAAEIDELLSHFPNGWIGNDMDKPLLDFKEVYFKLRDMNKPKNPLDAFLKAVAHRGYSSIAPENTLPAYQLAKEKGFSYVEADVIFSADGVGMLSHLDDLSVCTNGTGLVSQSQLSYLKTLDAGSWKSPIYSGTKMPTFEEFIILCKRLNLHPYIEVKKATPAQVGTLVNQCKLKGMLRNVTWIGAFEFLNTIKGLDEYARMAWVSSADNLTDANLATLVGLKNGKNKIFANLDQANLTKEVTERCLNQGLEVETWTVNNEQKVLALSEWGITGITTDGLNIAEILSS